MYNRYIPQPDGSYKKKQMSEPHRQSPPKPMPKQQKTIPEPCSIPIECHGAPAQPKPDKRPQQCSKHPPCRQDSITDFFKHLLPKNLDTADLLIILLLLLMAGDCEEEKNTALLTLALYFFM